MKVKVRRYVWVAATFGLLALAGLAALASDPQSAQVERVCSEARSVTTELPPDAWASRFRERMDCPMSGLVPLPGRCIWDRDLRSALTIVVPGRGCEQYEAIRGMADPAWECPELGRFLGYLSPRHDVPAEVRGEGCSER